MSTKLVVAATESLVKHGLRFVAENSGTFDFED